MCELRRKLNTALKKKKQKKKITSLRTYLVQAILRMNVWMKGAVGNYLNSFPGILPWGHAI